MFHSCMNMCRQLGQFTPLGTTSWPTCWHATAGIHLLCQEPCHTCLLGRDASHCHESGGEWCLCCLRAPEPAFQGWRWWARQTGVEGSGSARREDGTLTSGSSYLRTGMPELAARFRHIVRNVLGQASQWSHTRSLHAAYMLCTCCQHVCYMYKTCKIHVKYIICTCVVHDLTWETGVTRCTNLPQDLRCCQIPPALRPAHTSSSTSLRLPEPPWRRPG